MTRLAAEGNESGEMVDRLGILTMTHGTGEEDSPSNLDVQRYIEEMQFPVPTRHGFIQAGRHLQPAVEWLNQQKVTVIVAVILYPLSNNKEVGKAYVEMGLKPGRLKYEFYPVTTEATIYPSKLMEAHPLLADVTQSRLLEISQDPANEIGIYVTHGEFTPSGRRLHDGSADEMLSIIRKRGIFFDVRRASINPKDETLPLARELLQTGKTLLFTHGFTERSEFTESYIPSQLAQLPEGSYRWNSTPLLPHPAMREYILFRVAETLFANGRADLVFDEARAVWERYRDFEAQVSLPMLIPAQA
ncbi:MAG: hypothetical protein RMM58_10260 [Chloroflexota bacterium]|nr:hypothetical protein [Dehalococcoidia bacterium]MDW8254248.1 hypothetical protein [Chloroflexota bacterium]